MFYEIDHGIINLKLVAFIEPAPNLQSKSILFKVNERFYTKTFDSFEERDDELEYLKNKLCIEL